MKTFFLQLGVAVLVGLFVSIGLFFLVQGWTRSDMISVFTLIVAVWTAGVTRWAYIPQGELARLQLAKHKQLEEEKGKGKIEVSLINEKIYIYNTGLVELKNVFFEFLPFNNSPVPTIMPILKPPLNIFRSGEKFEVAHVLHSMGEGDTHYQIKITWVDPNGSSQVFSKTLE